MPSSTSFYARHLKRPLELLLSMALLSGLSPILLLVALLIRINMGSPVLFSQQRPGLHGKPFELYKFRSMTSAIDRDGQLLPNNQRLTRLGKWLRATSLDELPQLFNVLKGELSLIGPRPLRMDYLPLYSEEQARRHDVLPGITGWAQTHGRNAISWTKKFELDVWYVDHMSFWIDLKIFLLTLWKIIQKSGVNSDSRTIGIERFNGMN
jgi:sugar transferase EpsL